MRLIDADALRETLGITGTEVSCEGCTHYAGGWIGCKDDLPLGDVCDMIDDAPTVDAEPVSHGEWKIITGGERMANIYCTACNHAMTWFGGRPIPMKYCPNCGARMDAERKEE